MEKLNGFRDKDYLEQVTVLYEIDTAKDLAALPDLLDLFTKPTRDQAVDRMVVNALHSLLAASPEETIQGLASDHLGVKILCVQVAGESKNAQAVPALLALLSAEKDQDVAFELLTALSRIKTPECLPAFRAHMGSEEPYVATLCVSMLGVYQDAQSVPALVAMLEDSDSDSRYEQCDLSTWELVKALAAIGTEEALTAITNKLHHRNPTVRRIITDSLTALGEKAVPYLARCFAQAPTDTGGVDFHTLTANVLGFIGHRKGADCLVAAIDRGVIAHPNVKYAVYEALGRIGTMKGVICLMDGLAEQDELILMAVVTALDKHVNPGILKTLAQRFTEGGEHGLMLARAAVSARALAIFKGLYPDPAVAEVLVEAVCRSRDPEVVAAFREALEALGTDQAKAHAARLPVLTAEGTGRTAIAADDSRSMLALYRGILTDLGITPLTAMNGKEAYAHLEMGETPEIIITDMNMPVMDGMELVGKIRSTPGCETVPIIMVTTESEGSQRELAAKAGVTDFLTKPFKPAQLTELVKKYLP